LEAVCHKGMAARPEQRYPTARALAEDVRRWLADEPVSAWREPWTMRARRWVRRHRVLTASTTAALLVALALGSAGAVGWQQQQQQAGTAATEAMNEARLRLSDGRFAEAEAAAEKAEEVARTGGAAATVQKQAQELAEVIRREAAAAHRDTRLLAALLEVRGP